MHTMEKIEYRLTDMNYHTECGLLSNGRYDEIRKNIEAKNNEFDSKVGMKRQANYGSTFKFGEHHFIPVGSIKTGYTFARDKELNYSTYGDSKYPYTHIDFYKAMQNSSADVFKCVENGKLYIPGANDLFLYIGEVKYGKRGVH